MPKTIFDNKELRDKRFDTIVNTSLKLFAIYGYKKVTIDMITKECHYSHGLFYHYFSSKANVLEEIKKRSNKLFNMKLKEIVEKTSTGRDFLRETLCVILDFINKGSIENYYVHLLLEDKLEDLNSGKVTAHLTKEIHNKLIDAIKELKAELPNYKLSVLKTYYVFFISSLDGLSKVKINYPKLLKKDIDGYLFFDQIIAFLRAKTQ